MMGDSVSDVLDLEVPRCENLKAKKVLHDIVEEMGFDLKITLQGKTETRAIKAPQKGKLIVVLSDKIVKEFKNDEISRKEFKSTVKKKIKKSLK